MMMEKGTVNSSGEGEHCTQKVLLCGLGVSVRSRQSRSLLLMWLFLSGSAEGSGGSLKEAVLHLLKLFPFS